MESNKTITIIGTGNFGVALGKRLLKFGFKVVYGSRNPDKSFIEQNFANSNENVKIYSIKEAWSSSVGLVFFAIHVENYEETVTSLFGSELTKENKIVVDVSNKILKNLVNCNSNAEYLQNCFKNFTDQVKVVKAFNTISAYSLNCNDGVKGFSNSFGNGEVVPIASDDCEINELMKNLADQIGFRGLKIGSLEKAHQLESSQETTFSEWHNASLFCILFAIFNLSWYILNTRLTRYNSFKEFIQAASLIKIFNSVFGITALQLLAYTYLAGLIAALYQLRYGTKRKAFPKYLDLWLKSRKQLGLWAYLFAIAHMMISITILSSGYFASWHKKLNQIKIEFENKSILIPNSQVPVMTIHGDLSVISGVIAFILLTLLAISSINSIALSFNWSEWNFVQTKLGYASLAVGLSHDWIMYSKVFLENGFKKETAMFAYTRAKFYSIWLPLFVLVLKLVLTYVKPINRRLKNIRNGVNYNKEMIA